MRRAHFAPGPAQTVLAVARCWCGAVRGARLQAQRSSSAGRGAANVLLAPCLQRFCAARWREATRTRSAHSPPTSLFLGPQSQAQSPGRPRALLPCPQTHLQAGAFVPRTESQWSSITKALGHWEPRCPLSLGKGLAFFFSFLTLRENWLCCYGTPLLQTKINCCL